MFKVMPKHGWTVCMTAIFAIFTGMVAIAQDPAVEPTSGNENRPCVMGPKMLKMTDYWERQNKEMATVTIDDQVMPPETAAEMFITGCSRDLALVSGMAAFSDNSVMRMVRTIWSENLDFMKWWLNNRQQKAVVPMDDPAR